MPGKGKRKDNPGKMDRVNPPLKTRIPVTDHPEPQHDTPMDTSDTSDTSAVTAAALLFAREIIEHTESTGPYTCSTPPSASRAIWCLRELLTYIGGNVESIFGDEVFERNAQWFTNQLNNGGAAWVNNSTPRGPRRTESSTQTTPPPQSPLVPPTKSTPVTHTSSQTTPPTPPSSPAQVDSSTQTIPPIVSPTPKPKPPTNSVSTNTDPPPTRTYAEAATTTTSPKKTTPSPDPPKPRTPQPKGKGKAITTQTRATAPPRDSPLNQPRAIVFHAAPMKYKPGLMRRWIEEDNEGARILGIRWLLQEGRRVGKLASSLVIYLAEGIDTRRGLRMGRRVFRTSEYEWDR
ncbi:hypothetical protein L211DRAFT_578174 [Terfezia boudieri ATCC MYA-4762]|uniref:Uncharacterized protein n=1 Tax=Terfezia boudieri ATCC MYA-4762 TaxID=1051890 RepID=A0A3N4LAS2_9PEZI|nr:hypothetical protein L211DRAFT_578174 [Terfezia boudieri ATCC MYA-4762]